MIEIRRTADAPLTFAVTIRESKSETHHHVTLSDASYRMLCTGRRTPEECIEAAFKFLLDREAKESILTRFDIAVIARYFPEFNRELPRYFAQR